MSPVIHTTGFELTRWQRDAVSAWHRGDQDGPHRGTLEIVTGGGKTLIALACLEDAARSVADLRAAIVVPTEALARQWKQALERYTTLEADDIGLLGAGGRASFATRRVVVAVLNTAAQRLPKLADQAQPLMLIVDECHRAGAPTFAKVLDTQARFTLGLSATPDREEFDDFGEPLAYDEQRVGRALGAVVYQFSLRDARHHGWLPDYVIHHHGVTLHPSERQEYDAASRRVDDLAEKLRDLGHDTSRAQHLTGRQDDLGGAARAYVAATARRKDLLYRATERNRVTTQIVTSLLAGGTQRRVLLFHERVDEAVALYRQLQLELTDERVVLEHSRLSTNERTDALSRFRSGDAAVLVSVKSLIEGLDVPAADVGVSVASSSSVRQRIQSLGRVLRRQFDSAAPRKHAEMHLMYTADTVDEVIYAKEDWSDLTGDGANRYWQWEPGEPGPASQDGPPASPRPTESAEWERLGRCAPSAPEPWLGVVTGQEYSVDTLGTVTNAHGTPIANPQRVADMVQTVRGRPGGRFRVTPEHRFVLVWKDTDDGSRPFVAGQLDAPFQALPDSPNEDAPVDARSLKPGDIYPGDGSRTRGTYKLRQKQGGVIERRAPDGGTEFALVHGTNDPIREANARRVLDAWRHLFDRGITFHVNRAGHAWYSEGGVRKFLAAVKGGFVWPTTQQGEE